MWLLINFLFQIKDLSNNESNILAQKIFEMILTQKVVSLSGLLGMLRVKREDYNKIISCLDYCYLGGV